MHAALLANTAWLDEHLTLFQHLVVGLIDEQVRVAQVVPEGKLDDDASVFGEIVSWRETKWKSASRRRLAHLDEVLDALGVNLVHALDGRLWRAAQQLGARMNVPVVYSAFSKLDMKLLPRMVSLTEPDRAAFTAATDPLMQTMRDSLPTDYIVAPLRPGVYVPRDLPGREGDDETLCLVVAGNGKHDEHYQTLMEGAAQLIKKHAAVQLFFDGQSHDQRDVWRAAQSLGLLSNASFIPRRLGHRELLLKADAILHPQAHGKARGITLQAMAHGIPVIAQHDPALDYLIDGVTAHVLHHPDATLWHDTLLRCLEHPDDNRKLGSSARQWITQHRLASTSIAQALRVYRSVTGATMPFPETQESGASSQ